MILNWDVRWDAEAGNILVATVGKCLLTLSTCHWIRSLPTARNKLRDFISGGKYPRASVHKSFSSPYVTLARNGEGDPIAPTGRGL